MQDMIAAMVAAKVMSRTVSEDEFYRLHAEPLPRSFGKALRRVACIVRSFTARASGASGHGPSQHDHPEQACRWTA